MPERRQIRDRRLRSRQDDEVGVARQRRARTHTDNFDCGFRLKRIVIIAYVFSGAIFLATTIWLVVHGGPKYSVDFTGGEVVRVRLSQSLHADQVRQALEDSGRFAIRLFAKARERWLQRRHTATSAIDS